MSFHFVLFKFIVYVCIYYYFLNIFYISGSPWHKTDEYNCGARDGGRVCLLAGGPLDCSQSSIFP